jgi:hypothetical protein
MHIIKKGAERRADNCFEVIKIEAYPIGGGNHRSIKRGDLDDYEEFDPYAEEFMVWIPGLFIIDIDSNSPALRGFHKRQRWNGFACPVLLEEDIAKLAVEWNKAAAAHPYDCSSLKKEGGFWFMKDPVNLDDPEKAPWDPCPLHVVEFAGKTYECFDIGNYGYCWQDVEHNWLAQPDVEGVELDKSYAWVGTGKPVDGRIPVHQPPTLINCWIAHKEEVVAQVVDFNPGTLAPGQDHLIGAGETFVCDQPEERRRPSPGVPLAERVFIDGKCYAVCPECEKKILLTEMQDEESFDSTPYGLHYLSEHREQN